MVLPVSSNIQNSAQAQPSLALGAAGGQAGVVKDAYDLAFGWALNNQPTFRQFVTRTSQAPDHNSKTIVLQKWNYLNVAAGGESAVALSETTDVTPMNVPSPSDVTITAAEYGALVTKTEFLSDVAMVPFDQYLVTILADHAGKNIDELLQTKILAGKGAGTTGGLGIGVRDGGVTTLVTNGNLATTAAALTTADKLDADAVRDTALQFIVDNVQTWDGQNYVAVADPRVLADLREETGAGGWRLSREYMNDSSLRLLPNEVGILEGVRFMSNNRVRTTPGASSAKAYGSYFFGKDALAQHVIRDVTTVIAPQTDGLRRFFGLGWKATLGFAVYEPKAVQVLFSSSSRG